MIVRARPVYRYSRNSGMVKMPARRKYGRKPNATTTSVMAAIHS
jgi:hypothetical protein